MITINKEAILDYPQSQIRRILIANITATDIKACNALLSGALLLRLRMTSPREPAARAVLATLAVVVPTTDLLN